jgi:hypothetical protein
MTNKCCVVFTAKSTETILREGGTSSWRLDRNHARQCGYVVCTRNAHSDWVEGPEVHRSAFLIGKIHDVVPDGNRYLIQFNEFAQVSIPEIWKGDRNPVKYVSSLQDMGIDASTLKWETMPQKRLTETVQTKPPGNNGLTLAEAKRGLATTFGVSPDAVVITIRG